MEMKSEEAQICRLCGECESIYIDVFGEEGTKRFLGIKIHTKINIVIDEEDPLPKAICVQCLGKLEFVCDFQEECLRTQQVLRERYNLPPLTDVINEADGLSHKVCVRCLGALEFLCDFHEQCHKTQEILIEAKQRLKKCSKIKIPSSSNLRDDVESNKENCSPTVRQNSVKRKRQSANLEITQNGQISPLATKNNFATNTQDSIEPKTETEVSQNAAIKTMTNGISKDVKKLSNSPSITGDSITEQISALTDKVSAVTEKKISILAEKKKPAVLEKKISASTEEISAVAEKKVFANAEEISAITVKKIPVLVEEKNPAVVENEISPSMEEISVLADTKIPTVVESKTHASTVEIPAITEKNISAITDKKISIITDKKILKISDKKIVPDRSIVHEEEITDRKTRSHTSCNTNSIKKSQEEQKFMLDTPKMKSIAAFVKLEKIEQFDENSANMRNEKSEKTNKIVWLPNDSSLPLPGEEATRMEVIDKISEVRKEPTKRAEEISSNAEKTMNEDDCEIDEEESNEGRKKLAKITDLMSDEQKRAIEKFYTVDMSAVNERAVGEKIIFLDKKRFGCKLCDASYTRQDKCQVHIWSHLDMKPYRCNACDFSTVTVSNIRCHIRKSHLKIKPYACELCEKTYVTSFLLEEHMNTHTGSRPYVCNVCNFTSASRQVLSYHKTTHKPEKDITCHECGRKFYSKGRLRAHMMVHDKDKKANMCKLCSIYLCNSEALQRHHVNVHSKDYPCDVCGKRCRSKKALNNHRNVHSIAKYKCTLCSNVYKSSHILKEHILKHKGIRKYKCNICSKDFAQQSHLAAHMAVHSDKRFFCPGCNRPFNRHDNMKMHTKRCEAFLAKPELINLLSVRRNRSKPAKNDRKSVGVSKELAKNTSLPQTESIKTDCSTKKAEIADHKTTNMLNNSRFNNPATAENVEMILIEKSFVLPCT